MRQVYHQLCTYSADLFGINSALYELGGLIVMHDASGCNSTYNTHDEPRWYTMDSMIYVSGLNEKDAILGNDRRVLDDICAVALEEKPAFVAFSLSVLPAYMGTDVRGIARLIEKRTGIPAFGFATNGMDTYVRGAGEAFRAIAARFLQPAEEEKTGDAVNLLGVTPLDFSVCGNVEALRESVREMGFRQASCWAMGDRLSDLMRAPGADVSLVVSATGLPCAQYLHEAFGVPYVTGIPCGAAAARQIAALLKRAVQTGKPQTLWQPAGTAGDASCRVCIIAEGVHGASLRYFLEQECGCRDVRLLCPLEETAGALRADDLQQTAEAQIEAFLQDADCIIADPIYRRVAPGAADFVADVHDAYSGRMYHGQARAFVGLKAPLLEEISEVICK